MNQGLENPGGDMGFLRPGAPAPSLFPFRFRGVPPKATPPKIPQSTLLYPDVQSKVQQIANGMVSDLMPL